jgi:hypothetical protein
LFDRRDYDELVRGAHAVPGTTHETPKVAVSRAGFTPGLPLDQVWTPEELLAVW